MGSPTEEAAGGVGSGLVGLHMKGTLLDIYCLWEWARSGIGRLSRVIKAPDVKVSEYKNKATKPKGMLNTREDFNYFYCLDWWPPNTASTRTPKSLCPLGSPL